MTGFEQPSTSSSAALPSHDMKSPTAFRTISEVADDLSLPQHVLRFWESKFQQIKPLKRGGGRRYYRPEDIKVIHDIKDLLYNQGFTIRGVQKLLRETPSTSIARSMMPLPQVPMGLTTAPIQRAESQPSSTGNTQRQQQPSDLPSDKRREIESVLAELKSMRKILQQSGI